MPIDTDANKFKSDYQHLKWSLKKRAEIQTTLLALYGHVHHNPPSQLYFTLLLDHCIAAAFSLWRAVFLAGTTRSNRNIHEAQEQFLKKVVQSNAIGFSDDLTSSPWSVTFYLENAKARLLTGAGLAQEYLAFTDYLGVERLLRIRGARTYHTRFEWECVHLALIKLFNIIAAHDFMIIEIPTESLEDVELFDETEE